MFFLKYYFVVSCSISNAFSLPFEMTAHINELSSASYSIARKTDTGPDKIFAEDSYNAYF